MMHVITDFTVAEGAQVMLSRLLGAERGSRTVVAPLAGARPAGMLAVDDHVALEPLGVRSGAGLATATVKLAALIRRERPAAVLCWMYHAMVVGLLAARLSRTGTPVYWTVRQSLDDPAALSASTRIALHAARRLSPGVAGIIYNSERARAMHRALGYADDHAAVIPNGFDLPPPAPVRPVPRVFGIAARVHPQKDHRTFLAAAATVAALEPTARFVAVGRGTENLAPLAASAGLDPGRIELGGAVSDMGAFYRGIDALVLSSRTEGFPNVVAEAMAHGRPVVTTDVGDAAAVVGETGIVVPPGDAAALAAGMARLLSLAPDDYSALCRAARARVESRYALPAIARRYHAFVLGERT